jgi:hypothetical protein
LNNICLAVKRVFRGVSQASLDANERIKVLGKFLAASERSSESIKQWVEEAGHAQARLAATLRQVPSLDATHPLVALPELGKGAYPTELRGSTYSAEDIATIRRTAGMVANSVPRPQGTKPVETAPVTTRPSEVSGKGPVPQKVTGEASRSAVTASAIPTRPAPAPKPAPRPSATQKPEPTTLEHVQRLVKAAAAKDQAAEITEVRRANEVSNQAKSATATPPTRLRPEDVRALIEAAKKKAATKT